MFGTRFFQTMIGRDGGSEGSTRPMRTAAMDGFGRLHSRAQYVRLPAVRCMDGRELEGLVGSQSALSRADLRADPLPARSDRDGGRHDLYLRDRRDRGGARAGQGGGRRSRCQDRRRRRDRAPVFCARTSDRRRCTFRLVRRSCSVQGEAMFAGVDLLGARLSRLPSAPVPARYSPSNIFQLGEVDQRAPVGCVPPQTGRGPCRRVQFLAVSLTPVSGVVRPLARPSQAWVFHARLGAR